MAQRYPPELDEAIYTLIGSGLKPIDIRRKIRAGNAGLARPYAISDRTYFEKQAKLLRERGHPKDRVRPGEEVEAAEEIVRDYLGLAKASLRQARSRMKQGEQIDAREIGKLAQHARTARYLAKPQKDRNLGKGTGQPRLTSGPPSILKAIGTERAVEPATQNGNASRATHTDTGTQAQASKAGRHSSIGVKDTREYAGTSISSGTNEHQDTQA